MPIKWTYEMIAEEAKKYETRNTFKKNKKKAYEAAYHRGILDDVCSHMRPAVEVWAYKDIEKEARKYKTRGSFAKNSRNAYNAAQKRGILDEVCSHMTFANIYWTNEMLHDEAKKYQSRKDFEKNNNPAYAAAQRRGILDEVCSHMTFAHITWTDEMIYDEAKKYKLKKEFRTNSYRAYSVAKRRGILDDVCSHMKPMQTHLYLLEMFVGEKVIYKVGATSAVEKRIHDIKRDAGLEKYGEVYLIETDKCIVFEKEILAMAEPYELKEKFKGSGEIRQFDDDTLKFILKEYFGVDK